MKDLFSVMFIVVFIGLVVGFLITMGIAISKGDVCEMYRYQPLKDIPASCVGKYIREGRQE